MSGRGYYRVGSSPSGDERYAAALIAEANFITGKGPKNPPGIITADNSVMLVIGGSVVAQGGGGYAAMPHLADTLIGAPAINSRQMARDSGYTGSQCVNCNSMRMKVSGHCEVCDDCGTTTGCS